MRGKLYLELDRNGGMGQQGTVLYGVIADAFTELTVKAGFASDTNTHFTSAASNLLEVCTHLPVRKQYMLYYGACTESIDSLPVRVVDREIEVLYCSLLVLGCHEQS